MFSNFKYVKEYGHEFNATIKRIIEHPGVLGLIMLENQRQPIFTTMDNNKTFLFANRLSDLVETANNVIKSLDPEDELSVVRIRTNKYEIMDVLPSIDKSIIAVQKIIKR